MRALILFPLPAGEGKGEGERGELWQPLELFLKPLQHFENAASIGRELLQFIR